MCIPVVQFLASFSNCFSSPSFQTQSFRKSGLCLLQRFLIITGDNGGWHSVLNLSQDINANIHFFFSRVRLFSLKGLWLLCMTDSQHRCTTSAVWTMCNIRAQRPQIPSAFTQKTDYWGRSTVYTEEPTWKSGFAKTHERHHSWDQHMTILEKDGSLQTVHLSHSQLFT